MKRLTVKEEEIMERFWEKGSLFVKELLAYYDEPRPHFNTLSTIVRGLEEKGFLSHRNYGNTYQYYPLITAEAYGRGNLRQVIAKYFNNSCLGVVSSLIREEDVSVEELRRLLDEVEQGNP
jgi:predicted transcriptional regulator